VLIHADHQSVPSTWFFGPLWRATVPFINQKDLSRRAQQQLPRHCRNHNNEDIVAI